MKKVFTLCVAIMASAATFAQTTLWNGEDKGLGTAGTGFWDRCKPEVVENPTKDAVNSSDKCLKFTITGKDWNNGSVVTSNDGGYQFASKRLSLKIKKDDNSNVRVELTYKNGADNAYKKVAAWYDGAGKWQTLYFDFSTNGEFSNPTEIAIYPTTDNFDGPKEVYIDDVQIEDLPTVGGVTLDNVADGSLKGNIKLAGSWLKGECQNVDGEWQKVEYNDFEKVNAKLSDAVTSVDMRGTVTKDVDVNQFFKNPNTIVYADVAYDHANVVVNRNAANVELTDANAFAIPENFTAASVKLTRSVNPGNYTMCLPFYVSKDDMKATSIATFKEIVNKKDNNSVVTFEKVDHVEANVPFIANYNDAVKEFTFANKGVVNTNSGLGTTFIGTYTPGNMEGKYGLTTNNTFKKGGAGATTKAFRAYLELSGDNAGAKTLSLDFTDGETTGIESTTASFGNKGVKVYSLQGNLIATAASMSELHLNNGIYIINNKKVIIK